MSNIAYLKAARRLISLASPPPLWGALALAAMLLSTALGTIPPLLTGRVIDTLEARDVAASLRCLGIYAVIMLAAGIASFVNDYATAALRETSARTLRIFLLRKLHECHIQDLERLTLGQVANRVSGDINEACIRFEYMLLPTVSACVTLVITIVTMFALDIRFASIALCAMLLTVLPSRLALRRFTELQHLSMQVEDELTNVVNQHTSFAALTLLRNRLASRKECAEYSAIASRSRAVHLTSARLSGLTQLFTLMLTLAGPLATLAFGARALAMHTATVGMLVTFLMFQARLYGQFASLAALPLQLAGVGVVAKRILEIADLKNESSGDRPFADGDVTYRNVSVNRDGREVLRLRDVVIPQGSRAALVGASGSGKSTIAMLLARLYDPQAGMVRIADSCLTDIRLAELRSAVAVVSQDAFIFDASVRDNLVVLNPDASNDEIERALDLCRLRDVVMRLPDRLATRLGQRGARLSGGERQRICLARAVLSRPRILLLDEALTGVDLETEARIIDDLRRTLEHATLIVVTHRLSSIREFSPIVVLEDGEVFVTSSHEEARERSSWYRMLSSNTTCA